MKSILLFSAGKDSAACLWLLQPVWDDLEVVWVNPGEPHPLTSDYMAGIAKLVPHFREVRGQLQRQADHFQCCGANLWPLIYQTVFDGEVENAVSGVKKCDRLRSPLHRPGFEHAGVRHHFPVWDWSDEQVLAFLGPDRIPPSYQLGHKTSLDCVNCHAWENAHVGI